MKSEFLTPHAKALISIAKNSGLTVQKVLQVSGLAPNTFYKVKADLVEDGLVIEKEEKNGKVKTKRLYLTERGSKIASRLIDLELLTKSAVERIPDVRPKTFAEKLLDIIGELEVTSGCAEKSEVVKRAEEVGLTNVEQLLKHLKVNGLIYEHSPNCYRRIFGESD